MQYFGGKSRIAKELAAIINGHLIGPYTQYREPFCGGLNVVQHIRPDVRRLAQDFMPDLAILYNAIRGGWVAPNFISEERYKELKYRKELCPEKAFAGFACSFGAKYFGGYARGNMRNFADVGWRGLLKKFEKLDGVTFEHADFFELTGVTGEVMYCDPPYAGTTPYKTGKFDSEAFWQKVRELSGDNIVFVSEYNAPPDFIEVWRKTVNVGVKREGPSDKVVEKLFIFI